MSKEIFDFVAVTSKGVWHCFKKSDENFDAIVEVIEDFKEQALKFDNENEKLQEEIKEYSLSMHDIHDALGNEGHILDAIKRLKRENSIMKKELKDTGCRYLKGVNLTNS